MATERATLAYRPDVDERKMLEALQKQTGLSMSRTIGLAVRQMAAREKIVVEATEQEPAKQ